MISWVEDICTAFRVSQRPNVACFRQSVCGEAAKKKRIGFVTSSRFGAEFKYDSLTLILSSNIEGDEISDNNVPKE